MEVRAVSKFLRISPRKTGLVADVIRGKKALNALSILNAMNKRAARLIAKTLVSAISNAKNREINEESLRVAKVFVDGGPMFRRYMPRAMGRATMIRHKTSHITIVLSDGVKDVEKGVVEVPQKEKTEIKVKGKIKAKNEQKDAKLETKKVKHVDIKKVKEKAAKEKKK